MTACYFADFEKIKKIVVTFLTSNKSKKISGYFSNFEQVKKNRSYFADLEQIKKIFQRITTKNLSQSARLCGQTDKTCVL